MFRIGIDVGGTKVNIGIIECDSALANTIRLVYKQKFIIPPESKADGFLPWLNSCISAALEASGLEKEQISACGIGLPGTISEDGRTVLTMPNLGWTDCDAAGELEELTGFPVKLVQDSRAAAWGEYKAGRGRQGKTGSSVTGSAADGALSTPFKTLVCVTLGTGIGTGIVMDGRIYNGALGVAGETGHIPVAEEGRKCGCGRTACLECYVAGKGLDMTARELFGEDSSAVDLFEQAKSGNTQAVEALNSAITMLGRAMVAIINVVSPDCLLFSGGLSRQKEGYVDPLIEYIKTHCYPIVADRLTINVASLGEDSPMFGAALLQ